ncbi:MAG: S9 family peptidase [Gemmatimonadota bacterium]|nr:MAG: S9 family peptidase [Gemmatimonadota bacterium]
MQLPTVRIAAAALALIVPTHAAPALAQEPDCSIPVAQRGEVVDDYHGTPVHDPYRWLEDVDADETRAWIEAENCVTFGYLRGIPAREKLRERLTELWDYPKYETPFKEGSRYFYYKNDGLQNQYVLYKQESLAGEPEVLFDPNTWSEDGTVALTSLAFTEDGGMVAYGIATSGSDWREFKVRNVTTGEDQADHLRWIKFSGASWTHDGVGFFYSRYPTPDDTDTLQSTNLNQKLYYHRLGTEQPEDLLVYERPDQPEWGFSGDVTEDGRYLAIYVWHGTDERNRIYYVDLADAGRPRLGGEVIPLLDAFDASYSIVGNDGPVFYVVTNNAAPRYRLLAIDINHPEPEHWREIIPEQHDVLVGADIIHDSFVVEYMHDAHSRVALYEMDGSHVTNLELPTVGSVGGISGEREDAEMFYSFTSFLYPQTVFRYDFTTGETSVFRAPEIDFDPSGYETRQVFYQSNDGTAIPMFVTHRRGMPLDGSNPTYLYGYGGFNISRTPSFSISNLVWIEMGGVYASANLRGGGEYGEEWHQAGMKQHKQNVFDDFIAAAEYLIAEGYTSPERLAIAGGSNGGLLVGAVLNQRPDLFGAALPAVGVMDMLRFHKFTIGWAWVSDYGSPDDPEMFPHIYAYSPYHNIRETDYPAVMVTTADHDDRVVPGHSFKYTARLQAMNTSDRPILIRIQTKAGHGSGKPTSMVIEEQADRWAFLIRNLGMDAPVP